MRALVEYCVVRAQMTSTGVVALMIGRHGWAGLGGCVLPRSEAGCEFVEGDANPIVQGEVGGDRVVAAPEVLHECVPNGDGARRGQSAESAHWPQPCLEPSVIGFDAVVGRYEDLGVAGSAGRSRLAWVAGRHTVRPSGTGAPGVRQGGQAGVTRWAESPCC
jgi:hypothetical protein